MREDILLSALAFFAVSIFTVVYLNHPCIALASWMAAVIAIPLSFILDAVFSFSRKITGIHLARMCYGNNRYKDSFAAWCALIFGVADIFALLMVIAKWGAAATGGW